MASPNSFKLPYNAYVAAHRPRSLKNSHRDERFRLCVRCHGVVSSAPACDTEGVGSSIRSGDPRSKIMGWFTCKNCAYQLNLRKGGHLDSDQYFLNGNGVVIGKMATSQLDNIILNHMNAEANKSDTYQLAAHQTESTPPKKPSPLGKNMVPQEHLKSSIPFKQFNISGMSPSYSKRLQNGGNWRGVHYDKPIDRFLQHSSRQKIRSAQVTQASVQDITPLITVAPLHQAMTITNAVRNHTKHKSLSPRVTPDYYKHYKLEGKSNDNALHQRKHETIDLDVTKLTKKLDDLPVSAVSVIPRSVSELRAPTSTPREDAESDISNRNWDESKDKTTSTADNTPLVTPIDVEKDIPFAMSNSEQQHQPELTKKPDSRLDVRIPNTTTSAEEFIDEDDVSIITVSVSNRMSLSDSTTFEASIDA